MSKQTKKYLQKILMFVFLLIFHTKASANITEMFCSSNCAANVGVCFGLGENDCWACAQNLFLLQRNSSGVCQTKSQHQVAFYELRNSAADLSTYSSSKPTAQTCDQYTLSGQYVAGDYLQKTFVGIPRNHYQLLIRVSIGYIGTWNSGDQIQLNIDGQDYSWGYGSCIYAQPLCSLAGTDCFKTQELLISHDAANLTLAFTSSISQTDPSVQYWGVKDLTIVSKVCSSRCDTCFGPGHADCVTCSAGFFLLGNLCVPQCERFALPSIRTCVDECPTGFFGASSRLCEVCQKDCLVCTSANSCEVWSDSKDGLVWERNKFFWILLIIIGFLILAFVIYKIYQNKMRSKVQSSQNLTKSILSQNKSFPQIQHDSTFKNGQYKNKLSEPKMNNSDLTFVVTSQNPDQNMVSWVAETVQPDSQMNMNSHYVPKRKKRLRPMMQVQEASDHSIPSTIQLQNSTLADLRL